MKRRLPSALLLVAVTACATVSSAGPASPPPLSARLDQILDAPPFDQVQWGVLAVEATSGRVLYQRQADVKFIPASNMKLPVAATALELWGPEHRFETSLFAAGPIDPDRRALEGDLVLKPSGDPSLSTRFWLSRDPLPALADSLFDSGVREVAGMLVVDASGWDSVTTVGSWMVEDLPDIATGGAFALTEGRTTVRFETTALGQPARVSWIPFGEEDFVVSRVEAGPRSPGITPQVRASYLPESRQLLLEGTVPLGSPVTLTFGTRDPVRQAAAALARTLEERGIRLRGGWRVAWNRDEPLGGTCRTGALDECGARQVARITSPRLAEIVEFMLGDSHNWTAEQLVRALGSVPAAAVPSADSLLPPPAGGGGGGTPPFPAVAGWPTGLAAVRRYLVENAGVDTLDFRLRDGSGLSTQDLLTPRLIVSVLDRAGKSPWGDVFRLAMPEPGETGSTLVSRLSGLEGTVFAKTGTLTNVTALSGYLIRPDGSTVIFSILSNGSGLPASRIQAEIDELVRVLADR